MSQQCRLCGGDGICIHERRARCTRCKGDGVVPDELNQDSVIYVPYACGTCGGTHQCADTEYTGTCDGVPLTAKQRREMFDIHRGLKRAYGAFVKPLPKAEDAGD